VFYQVEIPISITTKTDERMQILLHHEEHEENEGNTIYFNQEKYERHESNAENEEIIKYKSADDRVKRKHPLTHVFDFFRVFRV